MEGGSRGKSLEKQQLGRQILDKGKMRAQPRAVGWDRKREENHESFRRVGIPKRTGGQGLGTGRGPGHPLM